MSKMSRIRQIAQEVKSGSITFQKGYNKMLMAIRRVSDPCEMQAYISNFTVLCK